MQKKLIALAVAGLASTAAFAQTNVTIYGVADAGYVYSSGGRFAAARGDANFSGIQTGLLAGSRIGFKGEEGLGNGLKTVFTLEYGISVDANGGIGNRPEADGQNTRQSFVGLNHNKLGTVALGRQYAPGFGATTRNDPLASSVPSIQTTFNTIGGNSIVGGSGARINNSVTYTSPNWSGFTVSGIYGFGEAATSVTSTAGGVSTGNNGLFGAGLNYANGPLNLDVVYQTREGRTGALSTAAAGTNLLSLTATKDSTNEWYVGGSYDLKVVKLMASYQDQNDNNGTGQTEMSNKVWALGAVMPVFGNGKVHAQYARINWDNSTNAANGSSSGYTLAYTHALSKRTTLYTSYSHVKNDNDARVAAGTVAAVAAVGESNSMVAAGINHTF